MDSSGVVFYYTTKARRHEMGLLQIGDPLGGLYGRRVGDGLYSYTFDCASSCTAWGLREPVTVFRESLHMHQTGAHMSNKVIRGGEVVHHGQTDYFDFDQVRYRIDWSST